MVLSKFCFISSLSQSCPKKTMLKLPKSRTHVIIYMGIFSFSQCVILKSRSPRFSALFNYLRWLCRFEFLAVLSQVVPFIIRIVTFCDSFGFTHISISYKYIFICIPLPKHFCKLIILLIKSLTCL